MTAASASSPSGSPSRSPCSGCAPPGSDLQGAAWAQTVEAPGFEDLALHHFYRTVPWLAAIREGLEQDLFLRGRDLFSGELDLVLIDTTSVYLYRDGASALVRHGYSRDRRPDLPQLVLSVAVDGQGWPVAFDVLPVERGEEPRPTTADVEALNQIIARFRKRVKIRRASSPKDAPDPRTMAPASAAAALLRHRPLPAQGTAEDVVEGCRGVVAQLGQGVSAEHATIGDHHGAARRAGNG